MALTGLRSTADVWNQLFTQAHCRSLVTGVLVQREESSFYSVAKSAYRSCARGLGFESRLALSNRYVDRSIDLYRKSGWGEESSFWVVGGLCRHL